MTEGSGCFVDFTGVFGLMLKSLTVKNYAVVESVEVDFASGLNVLTGETGAGKSVLMGALGFALGARADASVVRDGAKEAEVEADFGDRVVRRTVTREGRSRAWVDDESVSIAELREIGRGLVDLHGPSDAMRLAEESVQREALDAFGGLGSGSAVVRAYASRWSEYEGCRKRLDELLSTEAADPEALELLRYQVDEIAAAELSEEDETIAERHAAAAHAEEIVENAGAVTEALGGDESAAAILASVQPRLRAIARHFPQATAWADEAEEITLRIQELSRTVADAVASLEGGADDLAALDARLTLVNRLKRKYLPKGGGIAELLSVLDAKRARLDALENRDARLKELRGEAAAAEKSLRTAGAALTKARAKAGAALAKAVTGELRGLGFRRADFSVSLDAAEPAAHGCDRVVFVFSPNPGEAARPLAAIASSGEIARVLLALTSATLSRSPSAVHAPTLVFDEIDANIGGEVGRAVGERLRSVAAGRQVIALTHLPQTAVYGERHLVVQKTVANGRTRTRIEAVDGDERVSEIARMLGGEKITSVVRKHAQELLGLSS